MAQDWQAEQLEQMLRRIVREELQPLQRLVEQLVASPPDADGDELAALLPRVFELYGCTQVFVTGDLVDARLIHKDDAQRVGMLLARAAERGTVCRGLRVHALRQEQKRRVWALGGQPL
jgi:hypothetical protein